MSVEVSQANYDKLDPPVVPVPRNLLVWVTSVSHDLSTPDAPPFVTYGPIVQTGMQATPPTFLFGQLTASTSPL